MINRILGLLGFELRRKKVGTVDIKCAPLDKDIDQYKLVGLEINKEADTYGSSPIMREVKRAREINEEIDRVIKLQDIDFSTGNEYVDQAARLAIQKLESEINPPITIHVLKTKRKKSKTSRRMSLFTIESFLSVGKISKQDPHILDYVRELMPLYLNENGIKPKGDKYRYKYLLDAYKAAKDSVQDAVKNNEVLFV